MGLRTTLKGPSAGIGSTLGSKIHILHYIEVLPHCLKKGGKHMTRRNRAVVERLSSHPKQAAASTSPSNLDNWFNLHNIDFNGEFQRTTNV